MTMRKVRFERQPVLFGDITDPTTVSRLEIVFCNVETLDGIKRLTHVEEIHIYYCRSLRDISQLERLRRLRKISLYCLPNVEVEFDPKNFPHLQELSYNNVCKMTSLRGIEKLKQLNYLGLSRVKVLDGDYMPIVKCKSLKRVFWHGAAFKSPAINEIRRLRPDLVVGGNAHNQK